MDIRNLNPAQYTQNLNSAQSTQRNAGMGFQVSHNTMQYAQCPMDNHRRQLMTLICIDPICSDRTLICFDCTRSNHRNH